MILREAIVRQWQIRKRLLKIGCNKDAEAAAMAAEALKRLEELRTEDDHNPKWLLPGQMEEGK